MKKLIIIAIIFLLPVVFVSAGEITMQRLVGFDNYVPMFMGSAPQPANPNTMRVDSRYMRPITTDDNYEMFAGLAGSLSSIDTYLEFILASYYSPAVVQIRPAEADAILPVNNPRQADLKLGAAVFQEIQILRFLASSADPTGTGSATATAAVGRHEGILKFITDRGNVTRADIEAFYRNGIRALISEIVTEEFNKISFVMDNPSRNISYDAVLTRNPQNGRFTLSYVRPSVPNNRNEISDSSLDTL
ncbi:MAG: hypothetical protein FWD47_15145, partial [Treponema sp.]|nr:hypothetical protein [Treponema sp.]